MNETIAAALAAATTAAAAQAASAPAVIANSVRGGEVAAYNPGATAVARPRSLEDALDSAGANVDHWLQVKDEGFTLDKVLKPKFETIDVMITPSEVKFGYGCRYTVGGSQVYLKSYNGVTEAKGGKDWAKLIALATDTDSGCKGQYDLAEIPMLLGQDLDRKENGTLEAGEATLGYTTPITGYKPFTTWLTQAMKTYGKETPIPVRLGIEMKKWKGGEYPSMTFTTITN